VAGCESVDGISALRRLYKEGKSASPFGFQGSPVG